LIKSKIALLALLASPFAANAHDGDAFAKPINCGNCGKWNVHQKPFQVVGNTWYVGTAELSAVLVTGPQGHVLIDAALPQSAPQIAANIEALGFKLRDIKFIFNSHPHFDHAGGIAALARDSGAVVAASAPGAQVLGVIGSDDPQYEAQHLTHLPKLSGVKALADGETVAVGPLRITAHMTPGHTPGGASYSWQSCDAKGCFDVVYADSLNPVTRDGYFYTGDATTPDTAPTFAASIAKVAALRCDVALSAHPGNTGTFDKLAARTAQRNPFIDPQSCQAYAATARAKLDQRLAEERTRKTGRP
jgi:metallo-beta-lactamase class B